MRFVPFRPSPAAALLLGAFFFVPASAVLAEGQPPACKVPGDLTRLERPLPHTGERLLAHEALKIVAIGSSSTAGVGASSTAASYTERLRIELASLFPSSPITVINRGVNGQDASDMVARLKADVIDEKPDLVIWQLGTNAALRGVAADEVGERLADGIDALKDTGADVVLVDPQYVPRVIVKPETQDVVNEISTHGTTHKVGVFHRFAIMRHWHDAGGLPFEAFTSPDGLHMNDWSYACWGKLMASSIAEAATRPLASAQLPLVVRPNNKPATH